MGSYSRYCRERVVCLRSGFDCSNSLLTYRPRIYQIHEEIKLGRVTSSKPLLTCNVFVPDQTHTEFTTVVSNKRKYARVEVSPTAVYTCSV